MKLNIKTRTIFFQIALYLVSFCCYSEVAINSLINKDIKSKEKLHSVWKKQYTKDRFSTSTLDKNLFNRVSYKKPNRLNGFNFQNRLNQLRDRLEFLSKQKSINTNQIEWLHISYENFLASHLMRNEEYKLNISRINKSSVGASIVQKLEQSKATYQKKVSLIIDPLNKFFKSYQLLSSKTVEAQSKIKESKKFQSELRLVLSMSKSAIDNQKVNKQVRILRSSLPVQSEVMARRVPMIGASILASYDSNVLPTSEDLSSTLDAPLSNAITTKAKELEHDYIKIYDFVHNEIDTEWYVGASKGAEGTLLQKSGNDIDQASLLIALFRASGLAARYVHGVVELPVEKVNSSLGLSNAKQASEVLSATGNAFTSVIRGGKLVAFNVEYTWVSAYVPYDNYRGTLTDRSGEQWLPLMPSIKDYTHKLSNSLLRKSNIDVETSLRDFLATKQLINLEKQITNSVQYYLAANPTEADYKEQLGSLNISSSKIGLIPNTLTVPVVSVHSESPLLEDKYLQKVRFTALKGVNDSDQKLFEKTIPMIKLVNRRLTLSYMPASIDDLNLTNLYGGLDLVPNYLINLRPQIKLEGKKLLVAEEAIGAGVNYRFDLELITPAGTKKLKHTLISGAYHAINISTGKENFSVKEDDASDSEYVGAQILSDIGKEYNSRWSDSEMVYSQLLDVAVLRSFPSVNMVNNDYNLVSVFGEPQQRQWKGVTLDAGYRNIYAIKRDNEQKQIDLKLGKIYDNKIDYLQLIAIQGSTLEHEIFESLLQVNSISAEKGLQIANSAGQNILTLNQSNVGSHLTTLNHPENVIQDIQKWVSLGFQVTVPQAVINHNDWTGSVWVVNDLTTGSSGYFIAGGLAGGATSENSQDWVLDWLTDALEYANSPESSSDAAAANSIVKYNDSGYLKGVVGRPIESEYIVLVRDNKGRPVSGASVIFSTSGGGSLDNYTVLTDQSGLARTQLTLGQSTKINSIYQENSGDKYVSRTSLNSVSAWVYSDNGRISLLQPFTSVAFPDTATALLIVDSPATLIGRLTSPMGIISVLAIDQFGNPVSNVDVQAVMTADYQPCSKYYGDEPDSITPLASVSPGTLTHLEDKEASISFKTAAIPANILVRLGETASTKYPVKITGASSTHNFDFKTEKSCLKYAWSMGYSKGGHSVFAAKPGEKIKVPISAAYTYFSTKPHPEKYEMFPLTGNAVFKSDNGALTQPATFDGKAYSAFVTVGPIPSKHNITLEVTVTTPLLGNLIQKDYRAKWGSPIQVFAVEPQINHFFTSIGDGNFIDGVLINEQDISRSNATISYNILPIDYQAATVDVDILRDGYIYTSFIGSHTGGAGEVIIMEGTYFNQDSNYQAQVVLNRGTPFEIKSTPQNIPLKRKIILNYSKKLNYSHDVDIANGLSCLMGGSYDFELAVEAKVTLETNGTKLLDAVTYPKGRHTYTIEPLALLPGNYDLDLTAVATEDGRSEEKTSPLSIQSVIQNSLPIGHTLVKGVDVSNGNLSISSTDFSVPSHVLPLDFQRYYSSNSSNSPGALGVGWNHNYNAHLSINRCGIISLSGGTGGGNRFKADENGKLVPLKGYHGTLLVDEVERTFDFYAKDGTRYHYKNYGRKSWDLEYIEDTNLNKVELTYDNTSNKVAKLLAVEGAAGRTITFDYESRVFVGLGVDFVQVIKSIDFAGTIGLDFTYNDFGLLVSVQRDGSARSESYTYATGVDIPLEGRNKLIGYSDPNGNLTTYTYEEEPITIEVGEARGLVVPYSTIKTIGEPAGETGFNISVTTGTAEVTNTRGLITSYSFDEYGAVTKVSKPIGNTQTTWTPNDILISSIIDANGNKTTYSHDSHGNQISELKPLNAKITRTYHSPAKFSVGDGLVVKNRIASMTDENGNETSYEYDSSGNLTLVSNPDGGSINHSYSTSGDRTSSSDANGRITRFDYDAYGNVTGVTDALGNSTSTRRDILGMPVSVTDKNNNSSTHFFDSLQRLTKIVDALGGVTIFTYDPIGNKLSETDANGNTTSYSYDNAYRLTQLTNAMGSSQQFSYDPMGNKISQTDFNDNGTSYSYDDNDRLVSIIEPETRSIIYTYDSIGNKTSELIGAQKTTTTYDALYRATEILAPLNSKTTFNYDLVGNLIEQIGPLNRSTTYKYDTMNRVIKRTEPQARETTFVYDKNGNKLSETDAKGIGRKFVYDAINRLVTYIDGNKDTTSNVYDGVGNITSSIDGRSNETKFEYDGLNRKINTIDALGFSTSYIFDKVRNVTNIVMANGNQVINSYDSLNRLINSRDNIGNLTVKTYDNNSNSLSESDANGNLSSYTYDGLNRQKEAKLPAGRTIKSSYDIYHNRISMIDAKGLETAFQFDDLNRLLKITLPDGTNNRFKYDLVGNKTLSVDQKGLSTSYHYDLLNQLTMVTDARGKTLKSTYDLVGNKLKDTDKKGFNSTYTYDNENRLLTTIKNGLKLITLEYDEVGNKAFETDAKGNKSAFIYSKLNQLIEQSHPLAAISVFTYDSMGNQITARDPESRTSNFKYDQRNRLTDSTNAKSETTLFTYDGNGNRLTKQLPNGNAWLYTFDAADRNKTIIAPDGGSTEFSFDLNNNLLTQQDSKGNTTSFSYDSLNRRLSMTYPGSVAVNYGYDANGNRNQLTDANGKMISYTFDAINRKTKASYASSGTAGSEITTIDYVYDDNNNLLSASELFSGGTSSSRATVNGYDNFDRKINVTNGDNKAISYNYDANGNRTNVTDPDGLVTSYTYDSLNRVINVTNAQGITTYQYDRSGLQTQVGYPNGTQAVTTYDSALRTQSMTNLQNGGLISQFNYQLDANGNRLKQIETQGTITEETNYLYDSNDRLTQTAISVAGVVNDVTDYTYDANYNRLTEIKLVNDITVGNKSFRYNARNQVTKVTDNLEANNTADYTYDNNGNRIQKQTPLLTETYSYDTRDQIKEIKQGGSSIGQFLYDYQGLRISKTTVDDSGATPISTTLKYVYDDQSVLLQTDATGNTLSKYDYGANQLLSLNHVTEGAQFYLFDALGSVVNLTKADGSIQARYQYDAFGNSRSTTGSSKNVFGFTGHEKDPETGLYYFKARYYDPTLGQFLTQDAFEGMTDTPPSLHKYVYAYGNPTVWVDPDGNQNVTEETIDQVMRMPSGEDAVHGLSSRDDGVLDLAHAAGIKPRMLYGTNILSSLQIQKLKRIVQQGIGYDPSAREERVTASHPAFVIVTAEDAKSPSVLKRETKRMLGGYLSEECMADAMNRLQGAKAGQIIPMSDKRTEGIAGAENYAKDNYLSRAFNGTNAVGARKYLQNGVEGIWRDLVRGNDSNAPVDYAAAGVKNTAWIFAPFVGQLGRFKQLSAFYRSNKLTSSSTDLINNRLRRLGYDDTNVNRIMKTIENGEKVVVVGENMKRVNVVARMVDNAGGQSVTYAPRNWSGMNLNSLEANRSWIRYWAKDKKATSIDIGRQPTIRPDGPSPFYGIENRSLNRWNIYTPFSE